MTNLLSKIRELQEEGKIEKISSNKDLVVFKVINSFKERSRKGQEKYKKTLAENDLSLYEWLQHLKEELMDGVLYIQRAQDEIKSRESSIQ